MSPVCVKCSLEMKCKKNGVLAIIGIDMVHSADLWECPLCEHQIMTGWAKEPMIVSQKAMQSPLVMVDLRKESEQ